MKKTRHRPKKSNSNKEEEKTLYICYQIDLIDINLLQGTDNSLVIFGAFIYVQKARIIELLLIPLIAWSVPLSRGTQRLEIEAVF